EGRLGARRGCATMPRVLGRRARNALVAALCLAVPGVVLALPGAPTVAPAAPEQISATVTTQPIGQSMAAGFLGASFEYRAVHQYTGNNPRAVDPILVNLLRAMSPGYPPVLRIGGSRNDRTWGPTHGTRPPGAGSYGRTGDWLGT